VFTVKEEVMFGAVNIPRWCNEITS